VTAVNAARALEILSGDQPIDLLFSDVISPGGTNGAQLAVKARRVRPELKVLLTSGYTAACTQPRASAARQSERRRQAVSAR